MHMEVELCFTAASRPSGERRGGEREGKERRVSKVAVLGLAARWVVQDNTF